MPHAQQTGLPFVSHAVALQHLQVRPTLQGEALQSTSRHQAVAVGSRIYIHTHRSIDDILVLDTQASPPTLALQRTHGSHKPSSRWAR